METVFVIGAGASKEAKLPTGNELKGIICDLLNIQSKLGIIKSGDKLIFDALNFHVEMREGRDGSLLSYLKKAWHIRDALPLAISIDHFIDSHRGDEGIAICGKLAIIRSILRAEEKSYLYLDPYKPGRKFDYKVHEGMWYKPFFQIITENCERKDLNARFKSIALIIFNYDRCIEHYLYHSLQDYYGIAKEDAADLVKEINIYHPYGSVGLLPWWKQGDTMAFGARPSIDQLLILTNQIKTFTEGTDPESSEIMTIREHMAKADRLVFLGFAFHKLNMQLITPNSNIVSIPKSYATTYKISVSDKEVIKMQIRNLYIPDGSELINVSMADLKCYQFFDEFWRSLAF